MNRKNGNIAFSLTLLISLMFLVILATYIINMVTPFIWYQKLESIANKYVYVVDKFGYLTESEENRLYTDLRNAGFNTNQIEVDFPKRRVEYGTLFMFEIKYNLYQEYNIILDGIKKEARTVPLKITKYSYSKM